MNIAIDLDDTLANFMVSFVRYHNEEYGTSLRKEDFKSYKMWKAWEGTREQANRRLRDFYDTDYFRELKPIEGSKKAIEELKEGNNLFVVTSRNSNLIKETKRWINKNFEDKFSDIYFTNHAHGYNEEDSYSKSQICNSNNVDILIEDSSEYCSICNTPEREVFLLDRPWNRDFKATDGIERAGSWGEILKEIKSTFE